MSWPQLNGTNDKLLVPWLIADFFSITHFVVLMINHVKDDILFNNKYDLNSRLI